MHKLILVSVFLVIALTGCSTMRLTDTGQRGLFQKNGTSTDSAKIESTDLTSPSGTVVSDSGFQWPIRQGSVSSFYGKRKRDFHEGLDIRASRGSPIYAAREGEVIYSARKIRGYGNMVVIKHSDGMASVYAHNRKNLVRNGERVTQGQVIGLVGSTGKSTGPHVHFEIRRGELAQDPLLYLPQMRSPAVARK